MEENERKIQENERKFQETRKEFKKHYRYAMKLKEGGKAWDREMSICENLHKKLEKLNLELKLIKGLVK